MNSLNKELIMKALLYKINGNNCDFRHGKYDSCCTVQRFRLGFVGKYRSCSRPYQRGYHAEQYFLIFGIPLIAKSDTEPVRAVKVIINTLGSYGGFSSQPITEVSIIIIPPPVSAKPLFYNM